MFHINSDGRRWPLTLIVGCLLFLTGCSAGQMDVQPRCDPLEGSDFFEDGRCSRYLVDNTVARGQLQDDLLLYTGFEQVAEESGVGSATGTPEADGASSGPPTPSDVFPYPVTREILERGQEKYNVFCAPCHSMDGEGDGMVVRRGYPSPPSFHTEELRDVSPGYLYDVITNGIGIMPDYGPQVNVPDRWAIAAYVKVLQLSQNATLDDVPAEMRGELGR